MIKAFKLIPIFRGNNRSTFTRLLTNKCPSVFPSFLQSFAFSQQLSQKGWQLSDEEQRAVVSYQAIDFIIKFSLKEFLNDGRSIRQRIFSREHLTKSILEKANKYEKQKQEKEGKGAKSQDQNPQIIDGKQNGQRIFSNLSEAGFTQENIAQVLKAFDVSKGIDFNEAVFSQDRFLRGKSPNGRLVLMPNIGTGLIVDAILNTFDADRLTTYGEKGTGKSFAFLIYDYLSKFLLDYRLSLIKNQCAPSERFYHFVPQKEFKKIKKLFYIPIREVPSTIYLLFRLQMQFVSIQKYYLSLDSIYSKSRNFISQLYSYFIKADIPTVCIIDETNFYYDLVRLITKDNRLTQRQMKSTSDVLQCLFKKFNLTIFNSAQKLQNLPIQNWNANDSNYKIYDPYEHQRPKNESSQPNVKFSQILLQIQGHIYLYSLIWDQFCKHHQAINLSENTKVKDIFCRTFGIPSAENDNSQNNQKEFLWWKCDIRHLDINTFFNSRFYNNASILQRCNQEEITEMFLTAKRSIEAIRYKELSFKYMIYEEKSVLSHIKHFRFQILEKVIFTAFSKERKGNQNFTSQIEFKSLISSYTNKFGCKKQFQREIQNFPQQFDTGFKIFPTDTYKLGLLISDGSLKQISRTLYSNISTLSQRINWYIQKKLLSHSTAINFLNILHYQIFRKGRMNLRFYQPIDQIYSVCKQYEIKMSFLFKGNFKLNLKESLHQIIKEATNWPQNCFICYPAQFLDKMKSQNSYIAHHFYPLNSVFDFLIISSVNKDLNKKLVIHTFNLAVGDLDMKMADIKKEVLQNQLRQISIQQDIYVEWEHTLLGHQKQVKRYIDDVNKRGDQQIRYNDKNQKTISKYEGKIDSQKIGKMKLKLAYINFDKKDSHFNLQPQESAFEKQIWKYMKDLVKEIENITNKSK